MTWWEILLIVIGAVIVGAFVLFFSQAEVLMALIEYRRSKGGDASERGGASAKKHSKSGQDF